MPKQRVVIYARKVDRCRSSIGSRNCRTMLRTKSSSGWNGFGISATNCAGPKRISCATEFTNYEPRREEFITACCKEKAVPDRDINLAIRRKRFYETNPPKHTLEDPDG